MGRWASHDAFCHLPVTLVTSNHWVEEMILEPRKSCKLCIKKSLEMTFKCFFFQSQHTCYCLGILKAFYHLLGVEVERVSEDKLEESFLSFHHVDPRDQTQAWRQVPWPVGPSQDFDVGGPFRNFCRDGIFYALIFLITSINGCMGEGLICDNTGNRKVKILIFCMERCSNRLISREWSVSWDRKYLE